MQGYYSSNGLIKRSKCMYCLANIDEEKQEETVMHFVIWCKVMPGHLKREVRLQWKYFQKLVEAGWYEKGLGLRPPSLLDDSIPGREKRKKRKTTPI